MQCNYYSLTVVRLSMPALHLTPPSPSLSVSQPAPGVQLPAERAGVSPCHQTLLPQHQVPAGQQQRRLASPCGETLFSYLHEAAARGLSAHQALLQLTGEGPMCTDGQQARNVARYFTSEGFTEDLMCLIDLVWYCLSSA